MIVSADGKREAAVDGLNVCIRRKAAQSTAREHSFLLLVEANGAELFPVTDQLVLDNDLVYCKLALLCCQFASLDCF